MSTVNSSKFHSMYVQENFRTFLTYRTELNTNLRNPSELFKYLDVIMSSVRLNRNLSYCIWMLLHDAFDAFE